ncbi:hypothetical protein [Paenibacillus qinlingensis]|uniref:hypothetical protein n=1 Tax=Paenibacillus qinlingensis TaxID=1837343 RepID=UPI001564344D|nr:hypothetical protein [Paenibacillus qinlingensis]NQX58476.1 hypothetical protein [Paenibacillus qinlingensis]
MSLIVSPPVGQRLNLTDDSFISVPFGGGFTFTFYGVVYTSVFVNSNGNLTFGVGDTSFSESVPAFIGGPPRIAPLWDDLDPDPFPPLSPFAGGGAVFARQDPDRFVVTWYSVPEFATDNVNTMQIVLFNTGVIGFAYDRLDSNDGLVGVASGAGGPSSIFQFNGTTNPPVTIFNGPQGQLDYTQLYWEFDGTNYILAIFDKMKVEDGELKFDSPKIKFEIEGKIKLNSNSDGIDPVNEHVVIQVNRQTLALISPGSFIQNGNKYEFSNGETKIKFKVYGNTVKFEIKFHQLAVIGIDNPLRVGLAIGGDFGSTLIPLCGEIDLDK